MDPDVIPSLRNLSKSNRNQSNSVEWLDLTRSNRIRYRIDGPEYRTIFELDYAQQTELLDELHLLRTCSYVISLAKLKCLK
jgi:hypothetical protein